MSGDSSGGGMDRVQLISDYNVAAARQQQQQQQQQQYEYGRYRGLEYEQIPDHGGGVIYPSISSADVDPSLHHMSNDSLYASPSTIASRVVSPIPHLPPVTVSSHMVSPIPQSEQDELQSQQKRAIVQWGWRVKIGFAIHFIVALCLLRSYYWFTTVIGVVLLIGVWLYAYSIRQRQTNFVLVYVTILLVNLMKNVLILYFILQQRFKKGKELDPYEDFIVTLLFVDCAIFTPSSLYCCFYLHRSISLTRLIY